MTTLSRVSIIFIAVILFWAAAGREVCALGDEIIQATPPNDQQERMERFENRNSAENLEKLAHKLAGLIDINTPGVREGFGKLYNEKKYEEALTAYKNYFLDKLRHPDHYGIPAECIPPREILTSGFGIPESISTDELMQNIVTINVPENVLDNDAFKILYKGRQFFNLKINVGKPGSINWTFIPEQCKSKEEAPGKITYPDNPAIEGPIVPNIKAWQPGPAFFARYMRRVEVFNKLLAEYAKTKDKTYLSKWAEFADDWAMNQKTDADASPYNIMLYHPQEVGLFYTFLQGVTHLTRNSPQFSDDLPAATWVRIQIRFVEEAFAATIRQNRFFPANWRDNQARDLVGFGLVLKEFKISDFLIRSGRRSLETSAVVELYPDGTGPEVCPNYNWEYFDWGTGPISRVLSATRPDWMNPEWQRELNDNAMSRARFLIHDVMADGKDFPIGVADRRNLKSQFMGTMHDNVPGVFDDPENARIMHTVFGEGGKEKGEPTFTSEWFPYGGFYYLREGWKPKDQVAFMKSAGLPEFGSTLEKWQNNNVLSLFAFGEELLFVHYETPLTVDGRQQSFAEGLSWAGHAGWLTPTFAKVEPMNARWHTSSNFDFAEGIYSRPYGVPGQHVYRLLEGKKSAADDLITDVNHIRQVIFLKKQGLWIITDRLLSKSKHEYSQLWMLHVPEKDPYGPIYGFAPEHIEINQDSQSVKTQNPNGPNISLYHIGSKPVKYESILAPPNPNGFETWTSKGRDPKFIEFGNYVSAYTISRINAKWKDKGDQLLITVLYPRQTIKDELRDFKQTGDKQGICGFDLTLPDGTKVLYKASVDRSSKLKLDNIETLSETLLLMTAPDGNERGIAMGCKEISVNKHPRSSTTADFEFELANDRPIAATPIYRPIDMVDIQPGINVFVDQLQVTMTSRTPDVRIHYTLDGTDPTPSSPSYTGPVTLTNSATVKARAFRPGMKEVPPDMSGTEATAVSRAVFTKQRPCEPAGITDVVQGLDYEYYEGDWKKLFVFLDQLKPIKQGTVRGLLDISDRQTKDAFAFRYSGYFKAAKDGVYTFYAPDPLVYTNVDSGYDLQVCVDGQQWYPATRRHGFGTWSVALKKGLHSFAATYADFRGAKPDMYHPYKEYGCVWGGEKPQLLVSGPEISKQPIPSAVLWRRK